MSALKKEFYSKSAPEVAELLIGKLLVREIGGKKMSLMITETEAYEGFDDKASHASRGMTPRNKSMFSEGGIWYVYFVYGMHWMLNIVTGAKDHPSAVLIRGVEGVKGPARLTKYFGIDGFLNNKPASKSSGFYIEDRGMVIPKAKIIRSPRIGVSYAGPEWSQKPWRFHIDIDNKKSYKLYN